MSKKEKLFEKLKNNPKNISSKEFISALSKFGFTVNTQKGKGSHIMYYHILHSEIPPRTVNITDPLRKHHIITLIKDIEVVIS